MLRYSIRAGEEQDIVLNNLSGFSADRYGLVSIESSHEEYDARISVYGRSTHAGGIPFSYTVPISNKREGKTYMVYNSFSPSRLVEDSESIVANWLSLGNVSSQEAGFSLVYYDQEGRELSRRAVRVPALGRIDVQAGHEFPGANCVGLVGVEPDIEGTKYVALLTRYAFKPELQAQSSTADLGADARSGAAPSASTGSNAVGSDGLAQGDRISRTAPESGKLGRTNSASSSASSATTDLAQQAPRSARRESGGIETAKAASSTDIAAPRATAPTSTSTPKATATTTPTADTHAVYSYAIGLLAQGGTSAYQYGGTGGVGESMSVVELANPNDETTDVLFKWYSQEGRLQAQDTFTLPPHGQRHLVVPDQELGSVEVRGQVPQSLEPAKVVCGTAVYHYESQYGAVDGVEYTQGIEPFGLNLYGSYNLHLGMNNWLRVFNTTDTTATLTVSYTQPSRPQVTYNRTLPPRTRLDLGIHERATRDTYGLVTLTTPTPGTLAAQVVRTRDASAYSTTRSPTGAPTSFDYTSTSSVR